MYTLAMPVSMYTGATVLLSNDRKCNYSIFLVFFKTIVQNFFILSIKYGFSHLGVLCFSIVLM